MSWGWPLLGRGLQMTGEEHKVGPRGQPGASQGSWWGSPAVLSGHLHAVQNAPPRDQTLRIQEPISQSPWQPVTLWTHPNSPSEVAPAAPMRGSGCTRRTANAWFQRFSWNFMFVISSSDRMLHFKTFTESAGYQIGLGSRGPPRH